MTVEPYLSIDPETGEEVLNYDQGVVRDTGYGFQSDENDYYIDSEDEIHHTDIGLDDLKELLDAGAISQEQYHEFVGELASDDSDDEEVSDDDEEDDDEEFDLDYEALFEAIGVEDMEQLDILRDYVAEDFSDDSIEALNDAIDEGRYDDYAEMMADVYEQFINEHGGFSYYG